MADENKPDHAAYTDVFDTCQRLRKTMPFYSEAWFFASDGIDPRSMYEMPA
jgi:hypothetical protein